MAGTLTASIGSVLLSLDLDAPVEAGCFRLAFHLDLRALKNPILDFTGDLPGEGELQTAHVRKPTDVVLR
jgi:hypothetical protein